MVLLKALRASFQSTLDASVLSLHLFVVYSDPPIYKLCYHCGILKFSGVLTFILMLRAIVFHKMLTY